MVVSVYNKSTNFTTTDLSSYGRVISTNLVKQLSNKRMPLLACILNRAGGSESKDKIRFQITKFRRYLNGFISIFCSLLCSILKYKSKMSAIKDYVFYKL